ncbi:MAG: hypothetical protein HGA76_12235 [Candidatus Firestonebacteria bacterium]|nr:hypothetical protein [Candidatus Firestonebacteria bacterium]
MPQTLPAGIGRLDLSGRRMLRVRIPGRGILTGMRAFRFAQKFQSRGEYRLMDGERYEIRTQYRGAPCVEHWLPITGPETATTGAEETRGRGNLKSHWPLER